MEIEPLLVREEEEEEEEGVFVAREGKRKPGSKAYIFGAGSCCFYHGVDGKPSRRDPEGDIWCRVSQRLAVEGLLEKETFMRGRDDGIQSW